MDLVRSLFMRLYLSDCISGFFGPDCDENCGQCKNGTTCNSTSGICPDRCKPTWDGLRCDSTYNVLDLIKG